MCSLFCYHTYGTSSNPFMSKLNVADWFSLYRIIAVPAILTAIFFNQIYLTGWLLAISLLTDAIDGILARSRRMETKHGARLDSAGDMLTFLAGAIGVIWFGTDQVMEHLFIISFAMGLYLVQFSIGLIKYGRSSSFHTYSAKIAAILQGIFLITFYFYEWLEWLFWLAIIISILETIEELIIIFVLPEWETNVKGLYWVVRRKK